MGAYDDFATGIVAGFRYFLPPRGGGAWHADIGMPVSLRRFDRRYGVGLGDDTRRWPRPLALAISAMTSCAICATAVWRRIIVTGHRGSPARGFGRRLPAEGSFSHRLPTSIFDVCFLPAACHAFTEFY